MPLPLHVAGKRAGLRTPAPPPSQATPLAQLLRVDDGGTRYLVDTGAQVSALPPGELPPDSLVDTTAVPRLAAANGTAIPTRGYVDHAVTLGGRL